MKATNGGANNRYTSKVESDSAVGFYSPKTKSEVITDLGFTPKQVERFEMLRQWLSNGDNMRKGRFVMSTEKSITSEVTVCDTVDDSVIDFLAKTFYPLVMAEINKKERTENE